jgi:hypothetical protein
MISKGATKLKLKFSWCGTTSTRSFSNMHEVDMSIVQRKQYFYSIFSRAWNWKCLTLVIFQIKLVTYCYSESLLTREIAGPDKDESASVSVHLVYCAPYTLIYSCPEPVVCSPCAVSLLAHWWVSKEEDFRQHGTKTFFMHVNNSTWWVHNL